MLSLIYLILALSALSFLIFIHELGHYWVARRVGMRVEVFSIGIGPPILKWQRDGVTWQIGWLFFGGYVKIAGEEDGEISDGFYSKGPWARMKVAIAGPVMNLIFALLAFTLLWGMGGREKRFGEFTSKIGWIDPTSELYIQGVRPGDEVVAYGEYPYQSAKDHLYAPMLESSGVEIKGFRIDYTTKKREPFELTLTPYPHPELAARGIKGIGILSTADYLIYTAPQEGQERFFEGAPITASGIQDGDRILWADGELLFSLKQLSSILNEDQALLTVVRNGKQRLRRVPRIKVRELRLDSEFREELTDWQFAAGLNRKRLEELYTIPYGLNADGVVEELAKFIDLEDREQTFPIHILSEVDAPLETGDRIIAVDGSPTQHSYQILKKLQDHRVNVIVQRGGASDPILWSDADAAFDQSIDNEALDSIVKSLGTSRPRTSSDRYYLLKPISPKRRRDFAMSEERRQQLTQTMDEQQKQIEAIEDPERRTQLMQLLKKQEDQLLLGAPLQDHKVIYNPNPIALFINVLEEVWRTLGGLFSGNLSPKWVSGPVGIIQIVHSTWMVGLKDVLFWLGAISLNLGTLNLLPIPVLDGGTILLCIVEIVTGRRPSPKTLEKLILPFAILLIAFFLLLTLNDVSRILQQFLKW